MNNNLESKFFIANLLNYKKWIEKGDNLLKVANSIYPKEYWLKKERQKELSCFLDCFLMLSSFALENYLKAIIAAKNKDEFKAKMEASEKPILPKKLKGHDLQELAKTAGLGESFTEEQLEVLHKLRFYAIYAGRYHVSTNSENLSLGQIIFNDNQNVGLCLGFHSKNDMKIIESIIFILKNNEVLK
jgi:hypothetical protein